MHKSFPDIKIPAKPGIGLRWCHYQQLIQELPDIAWLEVHSENFFAEGGISLHILEQVREHYPMSFHGVGLSLGSANGLDKQHLAKLKILIDRFNPSLVSEHISWSEVDGVFLNDLLPIPYTQESLNIMCNNIDHAQNYLGRQILVENPSTYIDFTTSDMSECEFVNKIIEKSGCGLLLDVNNVYVGANNHGFDAYEYINNIKINAAQEIHLAGHTEKEIDGKILLIDSHSAHVKDEVWQLYHHTMKKAGRDIPTLVEWDSDIPALDVLIAESEKVL